MPVFPFAVEVSREAGTLAQDLHRQLRAAILDGRLPAGSPLPSTRSVATGLKIGRNTVGVAYDLLIAEGYAVPRKGTQAIVADMAARRPPRHNQINALDDPRINPLWRQPLRNFPQTGELPTWTFHVGVPDHRHFPHEIWRRLTAHAMRRQARTGFHYAPPEGIPELREAIARHVAFARAVSCTARDVVVTSGAQQALDLLARLLVKNGTPVAVESPGYPPLRAALQAAGAQLVHVPVDDEGLCVEQLPDSVRVVCVTPSHQAPSGVVLSLRRRLQLLEFARSNAAVVIEDDYDGEFRFGGRPLDALQTLDRETVFYVGTFAKSMFPSLRKGFVIAPEWAREALITVKQCADMQCDTLTQSVLATFIREGHLARHVRRMQGIYAERREALIEGIQAELGTWLEVVPAQAGLHLAARIRDRQWAPLVHANLQRCTPGVFPVVNHALLMFGYGAIETHQIRPALAHLGRALGAASTK